MTDRYLKVSPRGFANETVIFRVPEDRVAEAEAEYAGYEDDVDRGGWTAWVTGQVDPRDAVDWADRHRL